MINMINEYNFKYVNKSINVLNKYKENLYKWIISIILINNLNESFRLYQ